MKSFTRIIAILVCAISCSACTLIDYMTGEREANRIRSVGEKAQAVIVSIGDTGMTLNDDPIVSFILEVKRTGKESYRAETQGIVSRLHLSQVQPGAVIPVAVDPENPEKVAIDIYE